jgi:hypothetical protein
MWNNGRAVYAPATIMGATRDIFIENNIIDCSASENIYVTNIDSGHIKSNWFLAQVLSAIRTCLVW